MLVKPEKEGNDFQILAHERVLRAEIKHSHPNGFDTDVVCMGDIETQDLCEVLPEWHVEQLDGGCFFACRPHAAKAILMAQPIPLGETNGKRN